MSRVFFVFLLFLQSVLAANSDSGTFYNPPPYGSNKDEDYELEQVVQIRWATSMKFFSLVLWQIDKETNDYRQSEYLKTHIQDETEYRWIVSTQRDLKDGNTFLLQLIDDDNSKNQFTTKRFNITEKGGATTTTASSTPTFTETPPTTPTATASSSGLSPQTKVGVGVGVGLGGAFLIALAGIVWYFRRRSKNAAAAAAAVPPPGSDVAPVYYTPVDNMSAYKQEDMPQQPLHQAPVEVPGDRGVEVSAQPAPVRYELP